MLDRQLMLMLKWSEYFSTAETARQEGRDKHKLRNGDIVYFNLAFIHTKTLSRGENENYLNFPHTDSSLVTTGVHY